MSGLRTKRGVALLTALGFVAVMAAAAVAVTETVHVGVRRAGVVQASAQARWLALAAESFARETIAAAVEARPNVLSIDDPWARPQLFPAPGGVIEGRIRDASNCFNLNDFADDTPFDAGDEEPAAIRFFSELAAVLEIDRRRAGVLAQAARDWIDEDATPSGSGGREDFDYVTLDPPYRTAGAPFAHVSELRAVLGVSPAIYARLRPFLCVSAVGRTTSVNVNTITREDSALLVMLFGSDLSADAARRLIDNRPLGGWASVEAFLASPALADIDVPDVVKGRLRVRSDRMEAVIRVRTGEAFLATTSRFTVGVGGRTSVVEREYGIVQ